MVRLATVLGLYCGRKANNIRDETGTAHLLDSVLGGLGLFLSMDATTISWGSRELEEYRGLRTEERS